RVTRRSPAYRDGEGNTCGGTRAPQAPRRKPAREARSSAASARPWLRRYQVAEHGGRLPTRLRSLTAFSSNLSREPLSLVAQGVTYAARPHVPATRWSLTRLGALIGHRNQGRSRPMRQGVQS